MLSHGVMVQVESDLVPVEGDERSMSLTGSITTSGVQSIGHSVQSACLTQYV
ncbi:MAG: hypothetical protein JWN06_2343 [Propionibacteriaceae bacterium]|jgi:hypothetical protein|nr:hypothetical protein [Propionibacteriaceae bacterium]